VRSSPPKVFISYSRADEAWKNRLVRQLQVLALENVLEARDDCRIAAGEDWHSAIKAAMEQAQVAVFLVSANFLTSEFTRDQEVPRILKKRGAGLRVVPIIVDTCPWQRVRWLASIQGRPRDGQALALMKRARAEVALSNIAQEIADLLTDEESKAERIVVDAPSMSLGKVSNDHVPILVVTALPVEFKEVCAHLHDRRELTHPNGTVYELGTYEGRLVAVVEVGMGNAEAAAETERAISYFNPEVALFVGVAGGLKDVSIGDVVASTKVYGYESVRDGDMYRPRPSIELSSYTLEQRARAEARKEEWISSLGDPVPDPAPRALVGPIAAGEKLVAARESETAQFLRNQYGDALAVEMEGRGFLAAARRTHNVKAIVIRGISDLLDGKSTADASGSQLRAARHASAFAFAIVRRLLHDGDEKHGDELEYGGGKSVTAKARHACFYGLPPAVHFPFLGRNADIEQLHSALKAQHNEASPLHVAIFSSGGVGKTRMALEYAYLFSEYYTGGIFWAVVRDREPLAIWAEFGRQLAFEEIQLDTQAALMLFQYMTETAEPTLVVLDDVAGDDPRRFAQSLNISGASYPCLPTSAHVRVLITTRFSQVAGARSRQVSRLGTDAAVELLRLRAGRRAKELDAEVGLADIDLDGHPLALSLAGSYLRRVTSLSIAAYRERLREKGLTTELEIAGTHVRNEIPDHNSSIRATYRLSHELLDPDDHIDAIAIKLLDLVAFLAPGVELDAELDS